MAGVLLGVHAGSGVDYNTRAGCDTSLYHNQAVGNIDGCLLFHVGLLSRQNYSI